MTHRTMLFVIDQDTPDEQITDAAEAAAQNHDRLSCLLLGSAPTLPTYAYAGTPYGGITIPDNWGELVQAAQRLQGQRVDAIEALLSKTGASGDVRAVLCTTSEIKNHVARSALVCDEAKIAPNLRDTPAILREAAYGVLSNSPIGLRLNGAASLSTKRAFVAWDSSQAAASAVHASLPHLKSADEVAIACIDPVMTSDQDGQNPGADVAAWLSHHGCNVTVTQYPSGGHSIAQCLQDRAKEFGADLVIMGAYGHSRMAEAVFGGTTRSMIEQTSIPVLFAH